MIRTVTVALFLYATAGFVLGCDRRAKPEKPRATKSASGNCAARLIRCCKVVQAGKANQAECQQFMGIPPQQCTKMMKTYSELATKQGKTCD
jgi:hypothetical protein